MKDMQETLIQQLERLRSKLYAIRYGKRPKNRLRLKRSLWKEIGLAMKVGILGHVLKFQTPSRSIKEFKSGGIIVNSGNEFVFPAKINFHGTKAMP